MTEMKRRTGTLRRGVGLLLAVTVLGLASSAPPEKPRHDKWLHRNHEACRRASDAANEIAGRGPEKRTKHEGQVHDGHDT
jgi:hypothetical protein